MSKNGDDLHLEKKWVKKWWFFHAKIGHKESDDSKQSENSFVVEFLVPSQS